MSERPLVSVVTGTWQRHELLLGLIESLRAQTYRPLEHVIVSDGADPELRALLEKDRRDLAQALRFDSSLDLDRDVPIRFVELGFQSTEFFSMSVAAAPFLVAQLLARGELQMWAADDERFSPDHVEALVELLQKKDADFVSPLVDCYLKDSTAPPMTIGTDPPRNGTITHALYRRELLDYRTFRLHIGSGHDWDQTQAWLDAGARFALLPRVTMTHRIDKVGEGEDLKEWGQALRGLGGAGAYHGRRWKGYGIDQHGRLRGGIARFDTRGGPP